MTIYKYHINRPLVKITYRRVLLELFTPSFRLYNDVITEKDRNFESTFVKYLIVSILNAV